MECGGLSILTRQPQNPTLETNGTYVQGLFPGFDIAETEESGNSSLCLCDPVRPYHDPTTQSPKPLNNVVEGRGFQDSKALSTKSP